MSKRIRQYIGILAALAAYYIVHEGAHLLYGASARSESIAVWRVGDTSN